MNKKIFLAALLLLSIRYYSFSQIINIPDVNFKNALLNTMCVDANWTNNTIYGYGNADADSNNDGEIQQSEAEAIKWLDIDFNSIQYLEGIQFVVSEV